MKKNICSIIPVLFFATYLCSQTSKSISDIGEIRKNKYQIELGYKTIQNIYSNSAAATILLKKKYHSTESKDVSSVKYLRTYFTINSTFKFEKDSIPKRRFTTSLRDNIDLTFGLGIEKQFQNKKFVYYFGCDVFTNYFDGGKSQGYYTLNNLVNFRILYQYENTINAGFVPFIGIKYFVTDHLSFGIETGFSMSYFHSKFKDVQYSFDLINGKEVYSQIELSPYFESGIKLNYLGSRFITIGYCFK
jgi:hypothetical protein